MVNISRGGSSSFEWSKGKDSEVWDEPEVEQCMSSLGIKSVQFDGCAFDLETNVKRPGRQWNVKTTDDRILKELESKKCHHWKGLFP